MVRRAIVSVCLGLALAAPSLAFASQRRESHAAFPGVSDEVSAEPTEASEGSALARELLELRSDRFSLRAGEVGSRFTGYAGTSELRGVAAEQVGSNPIGGWGGAALLGVPDRCWQAMWDEAADGACRRVVTGGRLYQSLGSRATVGTSLVSTEQPGAGAGSAPDTSVASVDLSLQPWSGMRVSSEWAASAPTLAHLSEPDPNRTAMTLATGWTLGRVLLENDFERVGAAFRDVRGAAVTDRQEHRHRVTCSLDERLTVGTGYQERRDQLHATLSQMTVTRVYDTLASVRPLMSAVPGLVMDLAASWRQYWAQDRDLARNIGQYTARLRHTAGPVTYGGGYEQVRLRDPAAPAEDRDQQLVDVFVGAERTWGRVCVAPKVTYGAARDRYRLARLSRPSQRLRVGSSLQLARRLSGRILWSPGKPALTSLDELSPRWDAQVSWQFLGDAAQHLDVSYRQEPCPASDGSAWSAYRVSLSYSHRF